MSYFRIFSEQPNIDEHIKDMQTCIKKYEEAIKESKANPFRHPDSAVRIPTSNKDYLYKYCSLKIANEIIQHRKRVLEILNKIKEEKEITSDDLKYICQIKKIESDKFISQYAKINDLKSNTLQT